MSPAEQRMRQAQEQFEREAARAERLENCALFAVFVVVLVAAVLRLWVE